MTKILGSPHKIPKGFKEWLPTFSGEDSTMTENHLDSFLSSFEPYDQYEDVLMRLFSYSLIGKAKEWYNNISPREITNWDVFQNIFIKRFKKEKIAYPFMINSISARGNQGKAYMLLMTDSTPL
jgi:hypothetical protein